MNDNGTKCFHGDVGDAQPRVSSPIDRKAGALFVHCGDDELTELEENLNRLTLDIPDASIDSLPRRYQRHTTAVLGQFSHLLRRVARVIMCYHDHH